MKLMPYTIDWTGELLGFLAVATVFTLLWLWATLRDVSDRD